jgi:hypothetical protein
MAALAHNPAQRLFEAVPNLVSSQVDALLWNSDLASDDDAVSFSKSPTNSTNRVRLFHVRPTDCLHPIKNWRHDVKIGDDGVIDACVLDDI